jgi:hypothetical protein
MIPLYDTDKVYYLDCPECGEPAIPNSDWTRPTIVSPNSYPTWTEDDEAECPGCHIMLCANITGDGSGDDYMEAVVVEDFSNYRQEQ